MTKPFRPSNQQPMNADDARSAAEHRRPSPTQEVDHGMEREPGVTSLEQDIRAHTNRPHKSDVGRPGTNEEVFQGSKQKELP
jgi:hypothetical protein